jgi:hypothetical protein
VGPRSRRRRVSPPGASGDGVRSRLLHEHRRSILQLHRPARRRDGQATAWDPNADGPVLALFATDAAVYAGGYFTSIGGGSCVPCRPRRRNGTVPALESEPRRPCVHLAAEGPHGVRGGSSFGSADSRAGNLAALDASSGAATPWAPDPDSEVDVPVWSGGVLHAGLLQPHRGPASETIWRGLDAGTGLVTNWDPSERPRCRPRDGRDRGLRWRVLLASAVGKTVTTSPRSISSPA